MHLKTISTMTIFTVFVLYATVTVVYGNGKCNDVANIDEALATLQKAKNILTQGVSEISVTSHRVGFHALLSSDLTLSSSRTVVFDTIITNIGDAYDSKTGHFTAPYDGMYYISSSFIKSAASTDLHLWLVSQGNRLAQGYAATGNGYEAGSMSAVASLKKGDIVKVIHYPSAVGSQTMYGNNWCSFNGYLIN